MSASARVIQKRWNAVMRDHWKHFSKVWTRAKRHSSAGAVHKMRSGSRRLTSSIGVAALSAGVPGEPATRRLERISSQLGPLRDNAVYRKTLDRLKSSGKVQSFSKFLARQNSDEHRRLDKFFRQHTKHAVHRRIDRIERKLQRHSKDWTVGDYRDAFEKVLLRQYELLVRAHEGWEDSPDSKRFHRMRVELRELRYAGETIAEVLGLSHTRDIQSTLQTLKSLQTNMGNIHDLHKLRTELVAWISSRPEKKRSREMTTASEMQKEVERRLVEFKDHTLVSEDLLPRLQVPRRRTIRGTAREGKESV
jgi:CHAD domain-containing protein